MTSLTSSLSGLRWWSQQSHVQRTSVSSLVLKYMLNEKKPRKGERIVTSKEVSAFQSCPNDAPFVAC